MEEQDLKKNYEVLAKKYKLPEFSEINENFEIDKIDKNSDCLLRMVRKTMMDKIVNSLSFIDMLLNPVNAPRMYFSYIKSIGTEDKQAMDRIYNALAELSLSVLDLEIDYSEKNEGEMVKKINSVWNSVKPEFRKIFSNMKKPNSISKKEKSYFG